jgi:hypothetical protein
MTAHDPWGSEPRRTEPAQRLALLAAAVTVAVAGTAVVAVRGNAPDRRPAGPAAAPAARPVATRPAPRPSARPGVRPSPSPRPDGLAVDGTVVDTRGRPVRGATVRLTRHEDALTNLFNGLEVVATFGLVCIDDRRICETPSGSAVTDAKGRYTVYVTSGFTTYDLEIASGDTTMSAEVDLATARLPLPRATLWSPSPTLRVSGTTARIGYRAAPRRLGRVRDYHAYVLDPRSGGVLGQWHDLAGGATFDARLMQDRPVRVEASARVRTAFGDTWYSGYASARGRHRPDSRGRACVEYAGTRVVRDAASCRLVTDGAFDRAWNADRALLCPRGAGCGRWVGVDLGAVRGLRYVSVPGCATVQVSRDGRTWTDVAERWDCTLALSARARYVRASSDLGEELTEIAVWW